MKLELIDRQSWATRAQVRRAVFEFMEVFYNGKRLHSLLNFLSPVECFTLRVLVRLTVRAWVSLTRPRSSTHHVGVGEAAGQADWG
ncbi:MAG TPA: IS3 family transposase [Acidimicrobiales bacterium]|nr:IS3 family transposase [Acidimicrobiales bacterium]